MCQQRINELIVHNHLEEAITELTTYLETHKNDDEAFFMRGKLYWRMGERRLAMNDYSSAVNINPNSGAARALENAGDIQSFFNPDVFNP